MRTLTGVSLIVMLLHSFNAKETETLISDNQRSSAPTEITELDLPAVAFCARKKIVASRAGV